MLKSKAVGNSTIATSLKQQQQHHLNRPLRVTVPITEIIIQIVWKNLLRTPRSTLVNEKELLKSHRRANCVKGREVPVAERFGSTSKCRLCGYHW